MRWAVAISGAFVLAATTYAFPPGTPVGQPSMPGAGAPRSFVFRDVSVPINQVTALGNASVRWGLVDVVQMKKQENGTLTPEVIVSGARTAGISPDRKSVVLRIPDHATGALHAALNQGGVVLVPHH
jgi:hypothetical protein